MVFTEEPEEIPKGAALFGPTDFSPKSKGALAPGPEDFEIGWDESKWARGILNQDCIKASWAKLDGRVANFLALASNEEKDNLSRSRDEFQRLVAAAIEASKQRDPDATAAGPSIAERLKRGWSATNAVAYEYVKILDVMVGQAPEYVGLVYGAVKILLVAQVNNEVLKEKVKEYLEQIQLKFEIIDHLTAYMPSSQLFTLVADVYCLFNEFFAKAIKHYARNRPTRFLKAFTMPWTRFEKIIAAIESKMLSIKDVAQSVGLVEGHTTLIISQQMLALVQHNAAMVEEIRLRLDAISLKFSNAGAVRQTFDSLANLAEEKLNEPAMAGVDSNTAPGNESASHASNPDEVQDFDSWQNTMFPELQESSKAAARQQHANEELPNMHEYRSKRKSFEKSEMAIAWADSRKSEILWINGNEFLSRQEFNASFVHPLLLVGESQFDTFIKMQHFCEEASTGTDPYLVMMQDLVSQILRQSTVISSQKRMAITRGRTSTTEGLWGIFLELLTDDNAPCVFVIIGGIDYMVTRSPQPEKMRAEIVERFRALTTDTRAIIKIMVAMGFSKSRTTNTGNIASLVRACQPGNQHRRLSLDGLQSAFGPSMLQRLTDIQEGRCHKLAFTELPLLYAPGTMVYTQDNGILTAFVVSELSGVEPRYFDSFASLRLRVWSIDHNGRQICKRHQDLAISFFPGRRDVSSLACIPSGYLPGETTKRKEIIARGQKYWSYVYGIHYVEVQSHNGNQQGVIDNSARPLDPSCLEGLEPLNFPHGAIVKARFLMLAPAEVFVYVAHGLAWSSVNLDKLVAMKFPQDPLGKLILPREKKQMLVKAVEATENQTSNGKIMPDASRIHPASDSVNRLFLMFHGGPGTGKSFATQCLADYVRRPLFHITSGMVVNKAKLVGLLKTVLNLAERWTCLVLIDHVDVFAETRSYNTRDENAIVAEVVGLIDNHRGILIATTVKVGTIDKTLLARIDLPMEFHLNDGIRRQIWVNALDACGSDDVRRDFIVESTRKIAKQPLDGHSITSIVQSASKIARREQRDMSSLDVEDYVRARDEFSDYLSKVYGASNQTRARDNEWRLDESMLQKEGQ